MEAFDELRRLLLRKEQEQLRRIDVRLDDQDRRAREVAGVLPQAITISREDAGDALGHALRPSLEASIRESIERQPQIFVEAFYPIIGAIVRRAIAESLRGLVQSLNQTLEHTVSWQGMKWRMEARRTGRSFAEVVMLRSLVYRVEQLFLIHRETSLSLLHVTAESVGAKDADMVAGMLSAIQDFARDSFETGSDSALEEFRVGELQVWIAPGRHAYLAAVIRGNPSRELRVALEQTVENVHLLQPVELAHFSGDALIFENFRTDLEACLRAQYRQTAADGGGNMLWAKLALANAALIALVLAALAWRSASQWKDFLRRLENEPGLALTATEHRWFGASRVSGLRDPVAVDPAPLATAAGFNPARVRFDWKSYLALDPESVRRRFEQRFGLPAGVRAVLREGGALEVSGNAPFEWLEQVRREATQVPGVTALGERGVQVAYDPALALGRFTAAYPLPPEVEARMEGSALVLTGRAPYEWVASVRAGANKLPGIAEVREKELAVVFDPASVRRRFEELFSVPDTVTVTVGEGGAVTLGGEASHAWLTRLRQGAAAGDVAGMGAIDDHGVVDLDLQGFQQAKSVVESASVYFLPGKDNFATEGYSALSRLPDEVRRLTTAAKRLGLSLGIELYGSADNTGPEAKNLDLSRRRAGAVRDFLVSCGFDPALFQSLGLGAPPPVAAAPAGEKPAGEAAQRRVAFRVVSRTITTRP